MTKPTRPNFQSIQTVPAQDHLDDVASDEAIDAIAKKRGMPTSQKPQSEEGPQSRSQFRRTSISLFPHDEESIGAIAEILREKRGIRNVPYSMCIRVALRAITENHDVLAQTFDEIRAEDKRRK